MRIYFLKRKKEERQEDLSGMNSKFLTLASPFSMKASRGREQKGSVESRCKILATQGVAPQLVIASHVHIKI